ncbi:MAG: transposase family protein [Firmicutes bacterium]|nr:transposase family protein [Bacillota bacterium]
MNRFDKKFKEEAVRLVQDGGQTVSDVANALGIHANTLYKWINQYNKHKEKAFPGSGHLLQEDDEVKKLKKTVAELREENAILKKAAAIFARYHSKN